MIGQIVGAIIGSKIDEQDGEGGLKGALIGAAVPMIVKRIAPAALVLGAAWFIKRKIDGMKTGADAG